MVELIEQHREQIAALCIAHRVKQLELFGSSASGKFDAARSDLDFFVEFEEADWIGSSNQYFGLLHGLEDLFHRKVDLIERKAVTNPLFMEVAGEHAQTIYGAASTKTS